MTLVTWGLTLDIVGVILIAIGTTQESGASAYVWWYRSTSPRWGRPGGIGDRLAPWSQRLGWSLLIVGFALQLTWELTAGG